VVYFKVLSFHFRTKLVKQQKHPSEKCLMFRKATWIQLRLLSSVLRDT